MKGIFQFKEGPGSVLVRWAFHAGALCLWSYRTKPALDTAWVAATGLRDVGYYTSPVPRVPSWILGYDGGGFQLAIAGTNQLRQWLAYVLQFGMSDTTGLSGQTFAPFNDWSNVIADGVANVVPNGTRITITGHSLGGAMAILVAEKLRVRGKRVQLACTFGCPRVGDETFTLAVQTPIYNIRRLADLVPDVPPRAYSTASVFGVSVPVIPTLYRPGFNYVMPADWSLVENAAALVPINNAYGFIDNLSDAIFDRHIMPAYLQQLWSLIDTDARQANRDLYQLLNTGYDLQLEPAP